MFAESRSLADSPAIVIFLLLAVSLYFLPTIIAISRGHPNTAPIVVINILLGWSLLGWAASLAWSVSHIKPTQFTIDLRMPTSGPKPRPNSNDDWLDYLQ
jgi:hypothetical protein